MHYERDVKNGHKVGRHSSLLICSSTCGFVVETYISLSCQSKDDLKEYSPPQLIHEGEWC